MSLLKPAERVVVGALAALADNNPFLPERVDGAAAERLPGGATPSALPI